MVLKVSESPGLKAFPVGLQIYYAGSIPTSALIPPQALTKNCTPLPSAVWLIQSHAPSLMQLMLNKLSASPMKEAGGRRQTAICRGARGHE